MLKRLSIYLNEMFPATAIIGNLVTAYAVELAYLKLYDVEPGFRVELVFPAIVLTLIALLLRIMDEFKDYQDDLTNFPNRPLPSGRVKHKDLKALGIFCILMIVFLSTTSKAVLIWSLVILIFTGLMLKWFFVEKMMRKSLPLAFITHHPIVIFNFIYLILACQALYPQVGWNKSWFILPLCLIFTNWEIARKIRAPGQETSYTTYSKIFGPKIAIGITLILQIIFNACMVLIFSEMDSPWPLIASYLVLQAILIIPYVKFLLTLKLPKLLKDKAESQILVVIGFLLVASLL